MKILILRFSSIGDIVLTTPVIRCLRLQMPHAEIHYLTKPAFKVVLEHNPYIHQLHLLDKPLWAKANELRKLNFDLVVDLHHNLRTLQVKRILNVPATSFPKRNLEKMLLVNFKINRLPKEHIVDRYLETVKGIGINNDGTGLDYFIPEKDVVHSINGFTPAAQPYYAWAIGAQHFTKRLPNEKIIGFAQQLQHPLVLLGGKEDHANGEIIANALGSKCINLCGALNLNQSASMVQQSEQLFTNDTGLMHIGAALRKPIVSFWGNTLPAFGMTPYYGKHAVSSTIVENTELKCRPCSKIGFNKCPKGHFNCMQSLQWDQLTKSSR